MEDYRIWTVDELKALPVGTKFIHGTYESGEETRQFRRALGVMEGKGKSYQCDTYRVGYGPVPCEIKEQNGIKYMEFAFG